MWIRFVVLFLRCLSFLLFFICDSEDIIKWLNLGKSSSIFHSGMPSHQAKVLGVTWPEIMNCRICSSVYGPCCWSLTKSSISMGSSCPCILNAVIAWCDHEPSSRPFIVSPRQKTSGKPTVRNTTSLVCANFLRRMQSCFNSLSAFIRPAFFGEVFWH